MILTNDEALAKNSTRPFPGIQGGPLMHVIAAKAVAFGEALQPEFKTYIQNVITNAQALSDQLIKGGLDTVTQGTDTHVVLVTCAPRALRATQQKRHWAARISHVTKMAFPLIQKNQW